MGGAIDEFNLEVSEINKLDVKPESSSNPFSQFPEFLAPLAGFGCSP